ncbi:hypothetical protein BDR06DRAFT_1064545 [Suillus hirtellus]|nr:hypothetical protein BDR06DRAFT_1064545 [Suillus hirtellus]
MWNTMVDDIKLEYHPSSRITPEVCTFNEFKCHPPTSSTPPNKHPWAPFKSRSEFEIAELALEACLNNDQTDRLIMLCNRCAFQLEKFMFKNHKDICERWDAVSHRTTGWVTDLLHDPRLFPRMVFDVQHFLKFDGKTFIHFIDEPFTAESFWNIQSQLPPGGKPLAFILYVDKTRLSSFGTARGYPVVVCLANLPADIHNGQGVGSSYVVGWLLIVKEDRDHAGKPSLVNFKNTIWHESISKILSSLASKSYTGQWFECPDNILQWFFPIILILSADYKEQCIMSLIQGIKCLWPCPICLCYAPAYNESPLPPMRPLLAYKSEYKSQEVVKAAQAKVTAEEKEEKLKEYGLRDITNAFSAMLHTDVHNALSWDQLHFNGGLYCDYLWAKLQKIVVGLGQAKVAQMDKSRYKAFPCCIFFTDGSVYEDISKDDSPLGYLLHCCIWLFLEVDTYVALEVHTTETISAGRQVVQAFSTYLQQYIDKSTDESNKNWNFSKLHMSVHIFDNIEAKGAMCNYNTKPNERMHGLLKDLYLLCTNFRDVVPQDLGDVDDLVSLDADSSHVRLGSRQAVQTFELIEDAYKEDATFTNFWVKLNTFLINFIQVIQLSIPGGKWVQFKASDKIGHITECHFLKVDYESFFFNAVCFNCVFIQTEANVIFGCLLFLFECVVGDITHSLALIHPFDAPTARPRVQAKFFSVRSIICRALLMPDGSTNYLVIDNVDTDMFLHVKELHLAAGHPICI